MCAQQSPDAVSQALKAFLDSQGIAAEDAAFRPCRSGDQETGNNNVVRIDLPDRRLIAKIYYRSESDTRDRLHAEWSLLSYAQHLGIGEVPKPLACDRERGIAAYEFIEGSKLRPEDVRPASVEAAVAFFRALNGHDRHEIGAALPMAAEACFSIADHLALIDRRVDRLNRIPDATEIDREALDLVGRLRERWNAIRARIAGAAERLYDGLTATLPPAQRCVSPSDFGFHNALLRPDGRLCFIDFEYAGWDDPAKMAADFFCQPALPVDLRHFEPFLENAMAFAAPAEPLKNRARILLPAYRVKWSCIMLNPFLPDSAKRRRFANPAMDIVAYKRAQLAKAESALKDI